MDKERLISITVTDVESGVKRISEISSYRLKYLVNRNNSLLGLLYKMMVEAEVGVLNKTGSSSCLLDLINEHKYEVAPIKKWGGI